VAGPAGGPDETFRIAGLVNPAITVPAGARVSIQVVNTDPDTAHGLVITASADTSSPMPMMTSYPAFTGSALWFLGNPTAAGCTPPASSSPPLRQAPITTCAPSRATPSKA
jgi:FtsP/CotA-like multicopper oxidase with cupredoxin domain